MFCARFTAKYLEFIENVHSKNSTVSNRKLSLIRTGLIQLCTEVGVGGLTKKKSKSWPTNIKN